MTQLEFLPDRDTMYRAYLERDATFEGVFVLGVRTTGIFCRPTCSARQPKRENVEFFPRPGDALAAGFRPCKRCRPMEPKGSAPEWLRPLLQAIDEDPLQRWTSDDLRARGIEPARVRRWFQAEYGMTFLAYLRARRLGRAFSRIKEGADVLTASMEADFDSVSGFCEALRRSTGLSAAKGARTKLPLSVAQVSSPLGPIMVAGTEEAVYLVEFWDRRMLETQFQVLERRLGVAFFPGETAATKAMGRELAAYFEGTLQRFETPLAYPGTEHQRAVWEALLTVPYGATWTYGELARRLGRPAAVRPVARAVGENRLGIVVPCHRIIGSDGDLTGYGGGIWRKRFLLGLERASLGD